MTYNTWKQHWYLNDQRFIELKERKIKSTDLSFRKIGHFGDDEATKGDSDKKTCSF